MWSARARNGNRDAEYRFARFLVAILAVLCLTAAQGACASQVAMLRVRDVDARNTQKETCAVYESAWAPINSTWSPTGQLALVNPRMGCTTNETADIANPEELSGRVAVFERGNCFFSTKVLAAAKAGATAVIIVSDGGLVEPIAANATHYADADIPVLMVDKRDLDLFVFAANTTATARFKATEPPSLDYNFFVFFLIAWLCLAAAAMWARSDARKKLLEYLPQRRRGHAEGEHDKETVQVRLKHVLLVVIFASLSLMLIYFLYQYLVYVIIALFALSAAFAVHRILLLSAPASGRCSATIPLPLVGSASIFASVAFAVAVGLSVWWVVERRAHYAWVLQDILGGAFVISVLQSLRTPSFRVAAALLGVFLLYDVFFVFITPYITKNKDSVMVKAATGGGTSSEEIPLVFRVPRFLSGCFRGDSLLGFGDIIIPGLSVIYSAVYDTFRTGFVATPDASLFKRHFYFTVAIVAYTAGLGATFIALSAMNTPQPALLYLSPSLLLALPAAAWLRGELQLFWRGRIRKGAGYQMLMDGADMDGSDEEGDCADQACEHPQRCTDGAREEEEGETLRSVREHRGAEGNSDDQQN